jgi:hypothetical protein
MKIGCERSEEPSPFPLPSDGRGCAIAPVRVFLGPVGSQGPNWLGKEGGPALHSRFHLRHGGYCGHVGEGGSRPVTASHGYNSCSIKALPGSVARRHRAGRLLQSQKRSGFHCCCGVDSALISLIEVNQALLRFSGKKAFQHPPACKTSGIPCGYAQPTNIVFHLLPLPGLLWVSERER